jgi:hypothetical protein
MIEAPRPGKDRIMFRRPERRVSLVFDRRRSLRGGRRLPDQPRAYPSSVTLCPECQVGIGTRVASAIDGNTRKLTYRCAECNQQFDRTAKP